MSKSKIKSFLRDYFTLTSRERRGAIVLAIIICIQLCTIIWWNYLQTPKLPSLNYQTISFREIENSITKNDSIYVKKTSEFSENNLSQKETEQLSNFNPNTISDEEWMAMGLSSKQTHIIRNYLNKGGQFRDKESLAKIYGISPEMYKKLEPYIMIPAKENYQSEKYQNKEHFRKVIKKVNLNSADTLQLAELPLIGPGRARMIYKYREALGGFHHLSQLLEVFTIDSSVVAAISPNIELDTTLIRKININSDELKHPYLSKQMIRLIQAYRKQHGTIRNWIELQKISMIDNEISLKLVPYVAFE